MLRNLQGLVQPPVDTKADPHAAFGRLDVDIAGALLDGVVDNVVDQADHGRLPGDLLDVADVLDGLFDQRDVGGVRVFDDVVDHEDLGIGQRGDHPPNVFVTGGDDLDLHLRAAADFVDQEQVGGFGDGDREQTANDKQRQHQILLDVVAREHVDDLGVEQAGVELGVRDDVFGGQALDDLILVAILQIDDDFTQEPAAGVVLLFLQRVEQLLLGDVAFFDEQAAEASRNEGCRFHDCHR